MEINDELLRAAKRRAVADRRTLRDVVEAALRAYLGRPGRPAKYRLRWRTERGTLRPGVQLDDRDALWDAMEGRR
jgi:hypothetical protein